MVVRSEATSPSIFYEVALYLWPRGKKSFFNLSGNMN